MSVFQGIYSGYGPFTTANQTIPTQWEPSGNKQGYTEHNNFAQLILCTLNKKRQDVIIPPLQWHYGLCKDVLLDIQKKKQKKL